MTATQDLIAAALTAADELDFIYKHAPVEHTTSDLREACARAMVQPAAPDMAEVERLADVYADHVFSDGLLGRKVPSEHAATAHAALLDYVRGIMAERDTLIADNERLSGLYEQAVKGRADMRSALRGARAAAPQPVSEVDAVDGIPVPIGHAEADRLIGRLMSSDPDYDDCADAAALIQREIKGPDGFATWRDAAIAERIKRTQQPISAAEVQFPMPDKTLYGADRTVSGHFYTAAKVRTYGDAREAAGYAAGVAAGGKDAERYRAALIKLSCLGNGDRPGNSEGNEIAIAALRGEVKP